MVANYKVVLYVCSCKAYVTCCFPHYIRMCFTNSSKHHSYWRRGTQFNLFFIFFRDSLIIFLSYFLQVASKKLTLKKVTNYIADVICKRADLGYNYGVILIPEGLIDSLR